MLVILITLVGCSSGNKRNLLFSCNGVMYTHMVDDSFKPKEKGNIVPMRVSLYIGDKTAELNAFKYEICENGNAFIIFGNCEKRDLVNYHSFDLATHKLYDYDYYSESFRLKKNFPLYDESIRGEYSCEIINNKN